VEVLGVVGYDFVTFDLEHEPFNDESVLNLIRAADGVHLPSIVRMPCSARLLPFLDAGINGVLVPDLRGKEHAEQIVEMTRFYPEGRRTYYTQTRSARYGIGIDERAWTAQANSELLVLAMIEDIATVERLDDVLGVAGIDGFHIGPLDLAQSMGFPSAERIEAVAADVVRRCRAAGRLATVGVVTPWGLDSITSLARQGVQLFTVASAWFLTDAIQRFLTEARGRVPAELQTWPPIEPIAHNPYFTSR
jgi:2-keto-3-deoxy-L-rhamnonate aldolase RhmA